MWDCINEHISVNEMSTYYMKNEEKTFFGYTSLEDFANTLLGVKSIALNAWLSFIFAFTTFITAYIWDTAESVYTLMALMIGDWVLGVWLALRASYYLRFKKDTLTLAQISQLSKRRFTSTRAPRIFVSIAISLFLLSISWHLAKSNVLYTFLPAFIYGGVAGTYFVSLIENVAEFGLLSKDIVAALKEKLNPLNWGKKE